MLLAETQAAPDRREAAVLFDRLRSLSAEAATVTTPDHVRDRLLFATLVATGAFAGSIALIDGDEVQVFTASGYRPELLAELGRFPLDAAIPLAEAARTGEIIAVGGAGAWAARYPALEDLAEHPGVALPLSFGGGTLGAVGLSYDSPRDFDATYLAFLGAVATQVAAAVERVVLEIDSQRLLARHRAAERVVRASLLPVRVPAIRGWEIAARYEAAEGDLGGDFYDFIPLPSGGWAVVIGDVEGRGPDAAVVSALARQVLRDATATFDTPAAMLAHLNSAILSGLEGTPVGEAGEPGFDSPRFVTVAAVVITPAADGGRSIEIALAGHPQPLHGEVATGRVHRLGQPGGLLGLIPGPPLTDITVRIAPGDTVLLFTDGLVERHHGRRFFDEDDVAPILAAHLERSVDELADAVVAAANDFAGERHTDDTAVLVLRAVS